MLILITLLSNRHEDRRIKAADELRETVSNKSTTFENLYENKLQKN